MATRKSPKSKPAPVKAKAKAKSPKSEKPKAASTGARLSFDLDQIEELMRTHERHGITEMDVQRGDERIVLRRGVPVAAAPVAVAAPIAAAPVVTPLPVESGAPLALATVRSEGQFNTIIYEERDSYRAGAGRDAVFLNREDMAAFGVTAGQRITVRSSQGRMSATATPFDLPRGSALAYFPEANVLTATVVDPRSRTPAFKSVPVWIDA